MTSRRSLLIFVGFGSLFMVIMSIAVCPLLAQDKAVGDSSPARTGQQSEMQEMAQAMESMADMCRMMMQREMQYLPYRMAALIAGGILLTIALVLFIVLEVQWIRFWNLRIKTERQNLKG